MFRPKGSNIPFYCHIFKGQGQIVDLTCKTHRCLLNGNINVLDFEYGTYLLCIWVITFRDRSYRYIRVYQFLNGELVILKQVIISL